MLPSNTDLAQKPLRKAVRFSVPSRCARGFLVWVCDHCMAEEGLGTGVIPGESSPQRGVFCRWMKRCLPLLLLRRELAWKKALPQHWERVTAPRQAKGAQPPRYPLA